MFLRCEAPGCMAEAQRRVKILDPRRGKDDLLAYTNKYVCSDVCEYELVQELERESQYVRLVS